MIVEDDKRKQPALIINPEMAKILESARVSKEADDGIKAAIDMAHGKQPSMAPFAVEAYEKGMDEVPPWEVKKNRDWEQEDIFVQELSRTIFSVKYSQHYPQFAKNDPGSMLTFYGLTGPEITDYINDNLKVNFSFKAVGPLFQVEVQFVPKS